MSNNIQKIKERKGPEQSATLYKVGQKKKGNDGNIWIVTETQSGVKRWQINRKLTDSKNKSKTKSKNKSKTKNNTKNNTKNKFNNKSKSKTKSKSKKIFNNNIKNKSKSK